MHQGAVILQRLFGIEHEGQGLIVDVDFFRRVLGLGARIGDDGCHPLAGIACDVDRQRPSQCVRRFQAGHQRLGRFGELAAVDHVMDAGHFQRGALVDTLDARGGVRAGDQRHMAHAGNVDIGDVVAFAGDEAAVLAHAAIGADEAEFLLRRHFCSSVGRLTPRRRSAASAIASTICA